MSWIEVKAIFAEAPEDWSPYIDVFGNHGCENTLQTDKPPTLSAAVVDVDGAEAVVEALTADLLAMGVTEVESRSLVEENWEENWKQFFKPRRVGQRFVVRPTWETIESNPGDLEIVLDPGQAFGTGDHPTTRMCLELLEDVVKEGSTVADIGCGSGILSVGACKLGASEVVAVDIEPLSVEVAKENAELNGVHFQAIAGLGATVLPEGATYDVVVSNIISATLIAIAFDIAAIVKPGGAWIVSGIIEQNWPDVLEAAEKAGFTLVRHLAEGDWVGASLHKAE
ncbi:MAG: ribosomal protein L11 methyltransferase [Armatimonadetes bacterium 55-13]|nr:50S ribosomal protein L11 methyltransferase [Armatimonadota bacterium]OJU62231.1 MAG: ribosomal protein L11 methyltransferase [Armatimonadetes bacterium 55-13]